MGLPESISGIGLCASHIVMSTRPSTTASMPPFSRAERQVLPFGEAFHAEELLGEVLRREADEGRVHEADALGFGRRIGGESVRCQAEQAERPDSGRPREQLTPA